ncbi:MAG: uracil-DNA glycosylase [Spirochaetia bacterium]|nr:uracil-DNA glycosylase [Spirochaetia bacterium]
MVAVSNKSKLLDALKKDVENCKKCNLARTRNQTVFGEGSASARILFIGEGPGRTEDETGRPFVGRAVELLTRIIENGIGVSRSDVFIANIVKCRPTVDYKMVKDRPPDKEELACCSPYLRKQIEIIQPEAIITLGGPSAKFILNTDLGITKIRGKFGDYNGIPVMPTYHPSYILRNGGDKSLLKKDVWSDIKQVMDLLKIPIQEKTEK